MLKHDNGICPFRKHAAGRYRSRLSRAERKMRERFPSRISGARFRYAGLVSLAPKVSRERTAYPSTVERANPGRSSGARMSSASTRSNASSSGNALGSFLQRPQAGQEAVVAHHLQEYSFYRASLSLCMKTGGQSWECPQPDTTFVNNHASTPAFRLCALCFRIPLPDVFLTEEIEQQTDADAGSTFCKIRFFLVDHAVPAISRCTTAYRRQTL